MLPNSINSCFFVFEELWITQSSFIFISKYININKNLTGYKHNSQIYGILHKYPIFTMSLSIRYMPPILHTITVLEDLKKK